MEWGVQKMKILVTGATGFLGKRTAVMLKEAGHEVIGMGRNMIKGDELELHNVHFFNANLLDYDTMKQAFYKADAVVHCAALSSPWGKYDDFYQANVVATTNVIKACEEFDVKRLVHISTPSLYFRYDDRLNVAENDPLPDKKVNHYAQTKWLAEVEVQAAAEKGLETIILRPRAIFGPEDTTILPRLILANEKSGIPKFNTDEVIIDLTYVDNVVHAIKLSLIAPKKCLGEIYNITNGEQVSLHGILGKLFQTLNIPMKTKPLPYSLVFNISGLLEWVYQTFTKKEPVLTRYSVSVLGKSQTLNVEKAKKLLGYKPIVSVDEGVDLFAIWWNSQHNR